MIADDILTMIEMSSIEEVWAFHCRRMSEYGFDRLLYGYTRFKTNNSLGPMEDALILSNHPGDYVDRFFGDGHYMYGPMMRWCLENKGVCSWSWIGEQLENGRLNEKELRTLALNREYGVTAGYTICFKCGSARSLSGIGLTARRGVSQEDIDKVWVENERDLKLYNKILHLKISSLPHGHEDRLTDRQREVLEWAADGKSIADIARLIGRKPATVEKHLRLAREAMNAGTTAQAVLKASVRNQIFRL